MELWMPPRSGQGHRLVNFELDIDPPSQVFSYADSWGNTVKFFDAPFPHKRLTITARGVVETDASSPAPPSLNLDEWDRLASETVRGDCWDFLRPHGFAAPTGALAAFCAAKQTDALRRAAVMGSPPRPSRRDRGGDEGSSEALRRSTLGFQQSNRLSIE